MEIAFYSWASPKGFYRTCDKSKLHLIPLTISREPTRRGYKRYIIPGPGRCWGPGGWKCAR